MKRTENTRRLMALLLAMALMISFCPPVLAADTGASALPPVCGKTEGCLLEDGHDGPCALMPEVTEPPEPEETRQIPEETAEPMETDPPEETNLPEETTLPEKAPAPEETTPPEETAVPEETTPPEETAEPEEALIYTLCLTHEFWFTEKGEARSVRTEEVLELKESNFPDGMFDLKSAAYTDHRLAVTEALPLSLNDFDESRQGAARIVYAVADGWKLAAVNSALSDGAGLRDVFQGEIPGYEFVPIEVVRIRMQYKYSNVGGVTNVDASPPCSWEFELVRDGGEAYSFDFPLPNTPRGFRAVLDFKDLNVFLVRPIAEGEILPPEEIQRRMDNGDFDVDIANHTVYYFQEAEGATYHPAYGNIYSTAYNQAWDNARLLRTSGYTAQAYCGSQTHDHGFGEHGAGELLEPKLRVTLTEDQLESALENGLDITVYYRRNAAWYTVNHWVPGYYLSEEEIGDKETQEVDSITYVLLDTEMKQGRNGMLTRAAPMTGGVYDRLSPLSFTQQLIGTGTVIDIHYGDWQDLRVIFNTDYAFIPRQLVQMRGYVDFSNVDDPTRKGYTFGGWRYLHKNAQPDGNGVYPEEAYIDVEHVNGQYTLHINDTLLANAMLTKEDGVVPALHLYPKWNPAETKVTVILWTEDLTGVDDVQASAQGGNPGNYTGKYAAYSAPPVTHSLRDGGSAGYSNVGSFDLTVTTDSPLVGDDGLLLEDIQGQVDENFKIKMGQTGSIFISDFFRRDHFTVTNEKLEPVTTASADGETVIYVYFTRKIYTLQFHYFGTATWGLLDYHCCVATSTNAFSHGGDTVTAPGGVFHFYIRSGLVPSRNNEYLRHQGDRNFDPVNMPVPEAITITAKYGADLRPVWPVARADENIGNMINLDGVTERNSTARMISWATTDGKYRDEAIAGEAHGREANVMGVYSTMDAEIIAEPGDTGKVHHLVALWANIEPDYYRYNHCYELPGLDVSDAETVILYGNGDSRNDVLYLVPITEASITKFGFSDLMRVSYNGGNVISDPNGQYYAVREYGNAYYAVAEQVTTTSTNSIDKQNPSPRLHMTKVNTVADHTGRHLDTDGKLWGTVNPVIVGTVDAPYDLYFYYNRERYTITYMAASVLEEDKELGHINLPYGSTMAVKDLAISLDYTDTNQQLTDDGEPKYLWTYPTDETEPVPVCPDRNPNGTAEWSFKGWAYGPTGVNMQWPLPLEEDQMGAEFTVTGNLLIYAIWETPNYTVTFHMNNDTTGTDLEMEVPANRSVTFVGASIPRPVRNGYNLEGWYLADSEGNLLRDEETENYIQFSFDEPVKDNIHVGANWLPITEDRFGYTVYYVTAALTDADSEKTFDIVYILDGQIVDEATEGREAYFLLDTKLEEDQVFVKGRVINCSAAGFPGYIPDQTNKALEVNGELDDTYTVIFFYTPHNDTYTVRFVEAGTEDWDNPTVLFTESFPAANVVVTPGGDQIKRLNDIGYRLANRGPDGSYGEAEDLRFLTWLDQDNGLQTGPRELKPEELPYMATFLAMPVSYTITYRNAENSPDGADAALGNVDNPTSYTVKSETFTLVNPGSFYSDTDGKWYGFAYWTLPDREQTYTELTVEKGSVGNLTVLAHWQEKSTGQLTVSNTVEGRLGNRQKEFRYTVTLSDTSVNGNLGGVTFTSGSGEFTLRHGQSVTFHLPPTAFTVTQQTEDGYTTTVEGAPTNIASGQIGNGEAFTAAFVNTRDEVPITGIRDGVAPGGILLAIMPVLAAVCAWTVLDRKRRE